MRFITLPAFVFAVALAILFFKVYGWMTRPDVPRPVAFVVEQFVPGVELGAKVADARRSVAGMSYVPHVGFVGMPGNRGANMPGGYVVSFAQVRLLLDEPTRSKPSVDADKARIDAVEVLTSEGGAAVNLAGAFTGLFHKVARDGCLSTSEEGNYRDVHLWTTPNDRGGVAVITDFGGNANARYPGFGLTSVLAYRGPFDGSRTLRANYTDAPCSKLADDQ